MNRWRDKLSEIKDKTPEQLTFGDLQYLCNEIEYLREQKRIACEEQNRSFKMPIKVHYLDGNCTEMDLIRVIGKVKEPPHEFELALHKNGSLKLFTETSIEPEITKRRKFRLFNYLYWNNQPVYHEVES